LLLNNFLVQHNFNLLISLDGDEIGNEYRVLKNGKPSFYKILAQVENLRDRYPKYFEKKVNFNAVLHNKNSVSGIYNYFTRTFGKYPSIGALNTSGIQEALIDEFRELYKNETESLYKSEDYRLIERDMFINLVNIRDISTFIHQHNDFTFQDYNALFYSNKNIPRFPTGTCIPFSKKLFVTVSGKILCCERIGHKYSLGSVGKDGVSLDIEKIADNYNRWYDKLRALCSMCSRASHCAQCIYFLDRDKENPVCYGFSSANNASQEFSDVADYLEKNRTMYTKILKETVTE